jgi:hypothetical protein
MDISKYTKLRAFHVEGGRYGARLSEARSYAARTLARCATRLCKASIAVIRARHAAAALPAEGSPCLNDDEVARARLLLLGH